LDVREIFGLVSGNRHGKGGGIHWAGGTHSSDNRASGERAQRANKAPK
jgi:hypothetical protein